MITKGNFKDGTIGWKVDSRETNGVKGFEIHWSDDGECITDHVYEKDDANLIAAAPELLNALKYYFDVLEEVRGNDWSSRPDHVLQKMLSAVAKAEGRTA